MSLVDLAICRWSGDMKTYDITEKADSMDEFEHTLKSIVKTINGRKSKTFIVTTLHDSLVARHFQGSEYDLAYLLISILEDVDPVIRKEVLRYLIK